MAKTATPKPNKTVERIRSLLTQNIQGDTQQRLATLIDIEVRKDSYVLRMPTSQLYDGIWEQIDKICRDNNVRAKRGDKYATLDDLNEILGSIKWLWKDWIPRGFLTLMVGDPGSGKSMLALHWAKLVTEGSCWPTCPEQCPAGQHKCKPNTVVWVEAESSQQLLNARATSLHIQKKKIHIPTFGDDLLTQPNLLSIEHQEKLLGLVKAKNPALVIVDSLGGANTGGENRIEDVRPLLEFLAMLARDEDIAVLMTHHLRKSSGDETIASELYGIRGSTAIPAYSRSVIGVHVQPDDTLKLGIVKSNVAKLAAPLLATRVFDSCGDITDIIYKTFQAPPAKRTKKQNCSEWLLGILKDGSEMPLQDIIQDGEGQGYSRSTIYAAKEDILHDNIIVTGTGREAFWSLGSTTDMEAAEQLFQAMSRKG
jgi:hypothetical protein